MEGQRGPSCLSPSPEIRRARRGERVLLAKMKSLFTAVVDVKEHTEDAQLVYHLHHRDKCLGIPGPLNLAGMIKKRLKRDQGTILFPSTSQCRVPRKSSPAKNEHHLDRKAVTVCNFLRNFLNGKRLFFYKRRRLNSEEFSLTLPSELFYNLSPAIMRPLFDSVSGKKYLWLSR